MKVFHPEVSVLWRHNNTSLASFLDKTNNQSKMSEFGTQNASVHLCRHLVPVLLDVNKNYFFVGLLDMEYVFIF